MARQAASHSVLSHAPFPAGGATRRAIAASLRRRAMLSDVPFRLAFRSETKPLLGGLSFSNLGQAGISSHEDVIIFLPPSAARAAPPFHACHEIDGRTYNGN